MSCDSQSGGKLRDAGRSAEDRMTTREHRLALWTFILVGTAGMYYWNASLNALYSVVLVKYPDYSWLGDTFTAAYATCAFLTALLMSWTGSLSIHYNVVGGLVLAAMAMVFPIIVTTLTGRAGAAVLVIMASFAGFVDCTFQVTGYAHAVILPQQYGGWVSFGYGLCGVATFCLWMLFSQGIFDVETSGGIQGALWCHFGVAATVILGAIAALLNLRKTPIMKQKLEEVQLAKQLEHRTTDLVNIAKLNSMEAQEPSKSIPESYWGVFKKTWKLQCSMAFLMGLTMMAYPNIGPYGWGRSIVENDVLTGIFQIGDFVGRYIPNLAFITPFVLLPKRLLIPFTGLRVVLLVLFIIIKRQSEGVMQTFWAQIILMSALSLSHGWYASCFMHTIPQGVQLPQDRARASAMAVSLIVFAIAAGLWLAKLA